MKSRKLVPGALAATLALAAAGAYAGSRSHDANDVAVMANAKVTLAQAVTIAEQQAGGRALGADIRHEHGQPGIVVEVAAKDGTHKVLVDPASGKVTANTLGGGDEDGGEDGGESN
jgi:uncharacterized membrane protein YkoI